MNDEDTNGIAQDFEEVAKMLATDLEQKLQKAATVMNSARSISRDTTNGDTVAHQQANMN
jgi:hypothetical protein